MNRSRQRVATLLRVRKIQQQQAAAGLAARHAAVTAAQDGLERAWDRYRAHQDLDTSSGTTAVTVADRRRREHHAGAIPRRRAELGARQRDLEAQRTEVADRTNAVRGIERLDDRLSVAAGDELLRIERRDQDGRVHRAKRGAQR